MVPVFGLTCGSSSSRVTSARALFRAKLKSSTRKNNSRPLPGLPCSGLIKWGMLMCTQLMKAEQDRAIRVAKLTEVVMGGASQRLAEECLVPFEATSDVCNADDRPRALHLCSSCGLTCCV